MRHRALPPCNGSFDQAAERWSLIMASSMPARPPASGSLDLNAAKPQPKSNELNRLNELVDAKENEDERIRAACANFDG